MQVQAINVYHSKVSASSLYSKLGMLNKTKIQTLNKSFKFEFVFWLPFSYLFVNSALLNAMVCLLSRLRATILINLLTYYLLTAVNNGHGHAISRSHC